MGLTAKTRSTGKAKVIQGARRPRTPRDQVDTKEVALAIAEAGLDKKALNVELIDVRGKVDYADFVAVMSGRSDRQVAAIARGIEEALSERFGLRALGTEGIGQGSWVLMDFGDVVVHVFHEDTRGYYDLESLWMDAGRLEVQGQEPRGHRLPYELD
jgi:ribosome-associated protein